MFRTIIAGAAVAGALTLGAAGIAGASTPAAGSGANKAALCAKLPAVQARLQKIEAKVTTWVPKAQAREAAAKSAGHTTRADNIANRITKVQNGETKLNARLAKAQAACSASGSSTSTTS